MQEDKAYSFSNTSLLDVIMKHRKGLLMMGALAVLLSYIFSGRLFITPLFESSVVFFPATTSSVSKALLDANSPKQDMLQFGEKEEAEQMLQILASDEIMNYVIHKYHLMAHYKIDSTGRYPLTALREHYEHNVSFSKTQYNAIEIKVLDADAQQAADMANDIASRLDTVKNNIQRQRAKAGLAIVEREYQQKIAQVQSMEDTLNMLRKKGVFEYKTQSGMLSEEYTRAYSSYVNEQAKLKVIATYHNERDTVYLNTRARMEGAQAKVKAIGKDIKSFASYGGRSLQLNSILELEREQLTLLKAKYNQAYVDATQNIPSKFTVNNAYKAEKPSYPLRFLIVIIAFFVTEIAALIVFMLIDGKINAYNK